MTKHACKKIVTCVVFFALALALCIGIDHVLPEEEHGQSNVAEGTQSEANKDLQSETTEDLQGSNSSWSYISSLLDLLDENSSIDSFIEESFGITKTKDLPAAFTEEALNGEGFEETYMADTTFGFVYNGNTAQAANFCTQTLTSKGWLALEGSSDYVESFTKAQGTYQWIVLQYFSLEGKTFVVASANNT
jgi:hypothetical protein